MHISDLPSHEAKVAEIAEKAMTSGHPIRIEYDGLDRLVEVHAIGISKAGRPCMRVFQLAGDSVSGEQVGWKMLSIGKIFKLPKVLKIQSLAPREGYKKGDLGMIDIISEL